MKSSFMALGLLALFAVSTTANGQTENKRKGTDRARGKGANPERFLNAMDKNGDGKIDKSEAPERMQNRFAQIDANDDGFLDATELKRAFAARMQRGGQPNPPRTAAGKNTPGKKAKQKGADQGPPNPRPGAGQGLDLERLLKEGDKNGDGNLDPAEQKAIVARFNQMMARFRQLRGGAAKQKNDRFNSTNTDPVKPKRPGKQADM